MDGDQEQKVAKEFRPKRLDIFKEENIVFEDINEKALLPEALEDQ